MKAHNPITRTTQQANQGNVIVLGGVWADDPVGPVSFCSLNPLAKEHSDVE